MLKNKIFIIFIISVVLLLIVAYAYMFYILNRGDQDIKETVLSPREQEQKQRDKKWQAMVEDLSNTEESYTKEEKEKILSDREEKWQAMLREVNN